VLIMNQTREIEFEMDGRFFCVEMAWSQYGDGNIDISIDAVSEVTEGGDYIDPEPPIEMPYFEYIARARLYDKWADDAEAADERRRESR
jgi:hypothetical protein